LDPLIKSYRRFISVHANSPHQTRRKALQGWRCERPIGAVEFAFHGSSHDLPSLGCWEDTLQKVTDFIGAKEKKHGHVRFTPESGHCGARSECPLSAKADSCTAGKWVLFDHLVGDGEPPNSIQQSKVVEVKGAVDGTVWTQVFDHDLHPLCFRNAESYLEIAEAGALAAKSEMIPHAWLSKDNKGQRITQGREWIF
jgi:hypothetical protein